MHLKTHNQKLAIYLLSVLQLLALGCNNKSVEQHLEDSLDFPKKDTVELMSSGSNVINENSIPPYKEVDSLVRLLNRNFTFGDLNKLDLICLRSDGDLTESLDVIAVDLLNDHLVDFLDYLKRNPESCLRSRLIEGLGANFSVYERTERLRKLAEDKDRLISVVKSRKIGEGKIKLLNEIFNKVDPNLLD